MQSKNDDIVFPCSGCGSCCKRIDRVNESMQGDFLEKYPETRFPYQHEGGRCEKLSDDNQCTVYEDRPIVCDVSRMKKYYPSLSDKQFININIDICNSMMDEDKIDSSYRLKVIS